MEGASLRVKLVVPNEAAADRARANLESMLGQLRIGAEPHVLVSSGKAFEEVLRTSSADTDLVHPGTRVLGCTRCREARQPPYGSAGWPSTVLL